MLATPVDADLGKRRLADPQGLKPRAEQWRILNEAHSICQPLPQGLNYTLVRLTRPQLIGTMLGLILAVMLASLDQTLVGTAEPGIIAQLLGL